MVVVSATDDVAVASVSLWAGATRLGNATVQADGSWRAVVDSRRYPNGAYGMTAKATDAAGNVGTSAPVTIVVRN